MWNLLFFSKRIAQVDWCSLSFLAALKPYCSLSIHQGPPKVRIGLSASPTSLYRFIEENVPYTAGFTPLPATEVQAVLCKASRCHLENLTL